MKKPKDKSKPIINRRARFDYELGEIITAGIVLTGPEVRGIRLGHVRLNGSFAAIKSDELWLSNMAVSIPATAQATTGEKELSQARKLLVSKKQLQQIIDAKKQGLTVVPTRLFNHGKFIKVEIALARGKKKYDKRQSIKERDDKRNSSRITKYTKYKN